MFYDLIIVFQNYGINIYSFSNNITVFQEMKIMKHRPAGYEALIERYGLDVISNWHRSFVSIESQTHHVEKTPDGDTLEIFPAKYSVGE